MIELMIENYTEKLTIYVDITNVNELNRWLATDVWSLRRRLGRWERDLIRGHSREWAQAKERVAEQVRCMRAYRHASQVLGKDGPFHGNSTLTHIIIVGLGRVSNNFICDTDQNLPWRVCISP